MLISKNVNNDVSTDSPIVLACVLIGVQEPACDRGSCRKPNHRASTQFPRRSIPMQPAGTDGFLERKGSSHNAHKNATRSYL